MDSDNNTTMNNDTASSMGNNVDTNITPNTGAVGNDNTLNNAIDVNELANSPEVVMANGASIEQNNAAPNNNITPEMGDNSIEAIPNAGMNMGTGVAANMNNENNIGAVETTNQNQVSVGSDMQQPVEPVTPIEPAEPVLNSVEGTMSTPSGEVMDNNVGMNTGAVNNSATIPNAIPNMNNNEMAMNNQMNDNMLQQPAMPAKKSNTLTIILIVVAVVLIIAGVIMVIFLMK